jgi:valyl-tRNA synthetase
MKAGKMLWFTNSQSLPAAETLDGYDKISTKFKVKNFLEETNNKDDNITREELKSVQKSIAMQQQTLNKILNLLKSLGATINLRVNGGGL